MSYHKSELEVNGLIDKAYQFLDRDAYYENLYISRNVSLTLWTHLDSFINCRHAYIKAKGLSIQNMGRDNPKDYASELSDYLASKKRLHQIDITKHIIN